MTAPIDPRIEVVAKLLFTGPLSQMHADQWEEAKSKRWGSAAECLVAAEDVLRGIDEAEAAKEPKPRVEWTDVADELRKAGVAEEDVYNGVANVRLILTADPDRYWTAIDAVQALLALNADDDPA